MKVCLDPGHGGPDDGASGNGIIEKKRNLDVALALRVALRNRGHEVVMTRTSDTDFSPGVTPGANPITTRGKFSVAQKSDIFVSVHHDANDSPNFRGCSSFYWPGCSNGYDLASSITTRIHEKFGIPYAYGSPAQVHWIPVRPDGSGGLGVLRGGRNWYYVTACLVECATLTGRLDAPIIKRASYADDMATCFADGIEAHAMREGLLSHAPASATGVKIVGLNGEEIACAVGLSGSSVTVNAGKLLEVLGVDLTALKPGTVHTNGRAFMADKNGYGIAADLVALFTFTDKATTQGRRVYIKRV